MIVFSRDLFKGNIWKIEFSYLYRKNLLPDEKKRKEKKWHGKENYFFLNKIYVNLNTYMNIDIII